jgi:hypothetical protein
LAKAIPAKSQKEHEGKNEAQNGMKSQKTKKTFQLNDTEQQLTACKAEVIRLETMVGVDYYILWVSFFSCWDVICGCIYAAFFHFITALV